MLNLEFESGWVGFTTKNLTIWARLSLLIWIFMTSNIIQLPGTSKIH
jgi:hypothetical protein